ncbi:two-component response regulator-like APRR7 isoform X1 [Olea europaea subsp. europaea]|uniref:Two-component response regulator-like APRR7 isoform X1 n=1 Tax=Olea europaea subsp. europaea TaxID=158383 RepID=A0A8S0S5I3_OLEEU|nr:two-component response regulator-like APRR7 isoform X1 [Olea europaea subsp. europaea]
MSSHDSIGLVVKCLSKGAVDFLVKPVGKNELKNLWQHVWRRCHSSSGSGSESGTRTRKSVKSKSTGKFDKSGSYDGANNESKGLVDVGDGSEDSSWLKQAVEVGRSKAMSPIDQLADLPDSTCAQDTCSIAEAADNKMLQNIIVRKANSGKEYDTIAKDKSFEIVIPRNSESQFENPNEIHLGPKDAEQLSLLEIDCNTNNNRVDKGQFKTTGECLFSKHKDVTSNMSSPWIDCRVSECTREVANISEIYNIVTNESKKTKQGA